MAVSGQFPLSNAEGEDCFINVAIQCLRYIPELRDGIVDFDANQPQHRANTVRTNSNYVDVLRELKAILNGDTHDVRTLKWVRSFIKLLAERTIGNCFVGPFTTSCRQECSTGSMTRLSFFTASCWERSSYRRLKISLLSPNSPNGNVPILHAAIHM